MSDEAADRAPLVSQGAVQEIDTVATAPLEFPDFAKEFDRLRSDAQKVFDVRNYEQWLDQELEPHTVDVGEMEMKPFG